MTKRLSRPSVQGMLFWLLSALLIGVLAACTRPTDAGIPTASDSQAASTSDTDSTQSETPSDAEDPEDTALAWARCMRENGVPEFPDPDSQGRILLPGINPESAEFLGAIEACRNLAPEGWGESEGDLADEEVMFEFARCMRQNGVPDYPDPNPSSAVQIVPNDPKVMAALDTCKAILQDGGVSIHIGG